jgi:transcriptional regulator with XRE-family HTH domain
MADPYLRHLAIGDNVRRLRQAQGLTQLELARAGGVSFSILCKIENGRVRDPRLLMRLAAGLGVTIEELMTWDDRDGPRPPVKRKEVRK